MKETGGRSDVSIKATLSSHDDENVLSTSPQIPLVDGVIAALRKVFDPEIPVNVYDLGLIYRIDVEVGGATEIDMTLTAPACPVASEMLNWVWNAVNAVEGVTTVKVNLVFDPPWDQSKMSDEARLELGFI
jgi:FeS assembly SUF system protein